MKNPIKEIKAIKNSIDESKKSMDEIKKIVDDVKTDVDEVKENLQNTMEHAKSTSQEAKASVDQLKQGLQSASSSVQETKSNISSTKQDVTEGIGIIKEELTLPGGGFALPDHQNEQTNARLTAASSALLNPGAEWVEGGQLVKEGTAFFLKKDDQVIGEITYIPGPESNTWTLNHTYVNPQYRGGKIAKGLLDQVVQAARAENKKILPTCSYALAQFKRDRSYDDVWMQH